jgi:hypothetical protein
MKYQPVSQTQIPEGCSVVSSGTDISAIQPYHIQEGTTLAPPSGVEYAFGRTLCAAKDGSCQGTPAKGTKFCFGHLRSYMKLNNLTEIPEDLIINKEAPKEGEEEQDVTETP